MQCYWQQSLALLQLSAGLQGLGFGCRMRGYGMPTTARLHVSAQDIPMKLTSKHLVALPPEISMAIMGGKKIFPHSNFGGAAARLNFVFSFLLVSRPWQSSC